MSLWNGRFKKDMDDLVRDFNASIPLDQRLYKEDITGSIAHVTMLAEQGIIEESEKDKIIKALKEICQEIQTGKITFTTGDEDIHMAIESRLIAKIGDVGKKLHTARSRNDQVALDERLYLKTAAAQIFCALGNLEQTILKKAEQHKTDLLIGYTHLQHAQPITIGFWFMAYFQMFRRDLERLKDLDRRLNLCPLGACALAGTTLPTNRHSVAKNLHFAAPTENALDTVSDRDHLIEFVSAAATGMMHISRLAEELALWNTSEFAFVDIDDSFCTGSSIMPQKKNPDIPELLRGRSGRVYGNLVQLLTIMKGTPLAYNKDFQEDKAPLFDTVDTWLSTLKILDKMLKHTEFRSEKISEQLGRGFLNATDVAEHLVLKNIPFREAHHLVGEMVKLAEEKSCQLEDLTDEDLQKIDPRLNKSLLGDISPEACVAARTSFGGTAPSEVARQISAGKKFLAEI